MKYCLLKIISNLDVSSKSFHTFILVTQLDKNNWKIMPIIWACFYLTNQNFDHFDYYLSLVAFLKITRVNLWNDFTPSSNKYVATKNEYLLEKNQNAYHKNFSDQITKTGIIILYRCRWSIWCLQILSLHISPLPSGSPQEKRKINFVMI